MRKISILFTLTAFLLSNCFAQSDKVSGFIFDAKSKEPLEFVNLYIPNTLIGTSTNESGYFEFNFKKNVDIEISVMAIGYESSSFNSTQSVPINIFLKPKTYNINELEVTREKLLKDPNKIVRRTIKALKSNLPESYQLRATYNDQICHYDTREKIRNQICTYSVYKNNDNYETSKIHDYTLNDSLKQFRYNSFVQLPQYHIPDYGTNHLMFLLNTDPINNHSNNTFCWVNKFDSDFKANHWLHLDSIGNYNNEVSYFISVFLNNDIRYNDVNCIKPRLNIPNPTGAHLFSKYLNGNGAQTPIGRMVINTMDFAVLYFEYYNGFFNDRYKICAEYIKVKNKYYPSFLYFGNKAFVSNDADFNLKGESNKKGLWCESGLSYYNSIKKKYEKGWLYDGEFNAILKSNTIKCPSTTTLRFETVHEVTSLSKVAEDVLYFFELKHDTKILHHRYLTIDKIILEDSTYIIKSENTDKFKFIGDKTYSWNPFNGNRPFKDRWLSPIYFEDVKQSLVNFGLIGNIFTTIYPICPMPISSKDEYRYIYSYPSDENFYDKEKLIKGYLIIN